MLDVNRGATFLPATNDDEKPAVQIGDVLVFVYVTDDGTLQVSIDSSDCDPTDPTIRHTIDGVPYVRIDLNDGTIYP